MRYLFTGESKYHGTCRPMATDEKSKLIDGCSNQFYWLTITRTKATGHFGIDRAWYSRKVFSIGVVFRGYGRTFDIPLTRWTLETNLT